jgi:hypothetical protein
MKYTVSLSLFALIACLVSTDSFASRIQEFAKISKNLSVEELSIMLELKKIEVAHNKSVQELYARLSKARPKECGLVKAGISKLIAALATGYYFGMHHNKIQKTFDEEIRPALTLPTEEDVEKYKETFEQYKNQAKEIVKNIALKNPEAPDCAKSKDTETNIDQKN